jgi:hypothetical protein
MILLYFIPKSSTYNFMGGVAIEQYCSYTIVCNTTSEFVTFGTQNFCNGVVFLMNLTLFINATLVIMMEINRTKPYGNADDYFICI